MVNRRISNDVKRAAMRLRDRDLLPLPLILDAVGFSRRTFFRVRKLWLNDGRVSKPKSQLLGRPRRFHREDLTYLLALVHHRPHFFLDELADLVTRNRHISVHFTTIHRELERAGLSTKRLSKIASERNPYIRSNFFLRMGQYTQDML